MNSNTDRAKREHNHVTSTIPDAPSTATNLGAPERGGPAGSWCGDTPSTATATMHATAMRCMSAATTADPDDVRTTTFATLHVQYGVVFLATMRCAAAVFQSVLPFRSAADAMHRNDDAMLELLHVLIDKRASAVVVVIVERQRCGRP